MSGNGTVLSAFTWGRFGDESCYFDQDSNQTEPQSNAENPYKSSLLPTAADGNQLAYVPAYGACGECGVVGEEGYRNTKNVDFKHIREVIQNYDNRM